MLNPKSLAAVLATATSAAICGVQAIAGIVKPPLTTVDVPATVVRAPMAKTASVTACRSAGSVMRTSILACA